MDIIIELCRTSIFVYDIINIVADAEQLLTRKQTTNLIILKIIKKVLTDKFLGDKINESLEGDDIKWSLKIEQNIEKHLEPAILFTSKF